MIDPPRWTRDQLQANLTGALEIFRRERLDNLEEAQSRGLTLFWAHDLKPLIDWVDSTRPG